MEALLQDVAQCINAVLARLHEGDGVGDAVQHGIVLPDHVQKQQRARKQSTTNAADYVVPLLRLVAGDGALFVRLCRELETTLPDRKGLLSQLPKRSAILLARVGVDGPFLTLHVSRPAVCAAVCAAAFARCPPRPCTEVPAPPTHNVIIVDGMFPVASSLQQWRMELVCDHAVRLLRASGHHRCQPADFWGEGGGSFGSDDGGGSFDISEQSLLAVLAERMGLVVNAAEHECKISCIASSDDTPWYLSLRTESAAAQSDVDATPRLGHLRQLIQWLTPSSACRVLVLVSKQRAQTCQRLLRLARRCVAVLGLSATAALEWLPCDTVVLARGSAAQSLPEKHTLVQNLREELMQVTAQRVTGSQSDSQQDLVDSMLKAASRFVLLGTRADHPVRLPYLCKGKALAHESQGPAVVYNCVRLSSVLGRFQTLGLVLPDLQSIDFALLREREEWELLSDNVPALLNLGNESQRGEPHTHKAVQLLAKTCNLFSKYYAQNRILLPDQQQQLMFARVYLATAVQKAMVHALALLGIDTIPAEV
eukprot:m.208498 g.208498  ORF g.208498 m.208498 type:complete len:538 (+) comp18536_c0_seq1:41-1654(+)